MKLPAREICPFEARHSFWTWITKWTSFNNYASLQCWKAKTKIIPSHIFFCICCNNNIEKTESNKLWNNFNAIRLRKSKASYYTTCKLYGRYFLAPDKSWVRLRSAANIWISDQDVISSLCSWTAKCNYEFENDQYF